MVFLDGKAVGLHPEMSERVWLELHLQVHVCSNVWRNCTDAFLSYKQLSSLLLLLQYADDFQTNSKVKHCF